MRIITIPILLEGKIFHIQNYKRNYLWTEKQWKDFVHDIDEVIDEKINGHYMGTIIMYQQPALNRPTEKYGKRILEVVEIIDGQQRLITISLYLSIILNELIQVDPYNFSKEPAHFLNAGNKSKLRINTKDQVFYLNLISNESNKLQPKNSNQKRIYDAFYFLKGHLENQINQRKVEKKEYLKDLFYAIIQKLNFSTYLIEDNSQIQRTLDLINSRGL